MNRVKIGNREYPCRMTMGAMMQFKQETGLEVSELSKTGLSEVMTFLWCCVKSACRADGVDFEMNAVEMADMIEVGEFGRWQESFTGGESTAKKKV